MSDRSDDGDLARPEELFRSSRVLVEFPVVDLPELRGDLDLRFLAPAQKSCEVFKQEQAACTDLMKERKLLTLLPLAVA